jgi:plastocyanin
MRRLALALALVSIVAGTFAAIALGATKTVKMGDNFFFVGSVTVKKGSKVHWTWNTKHKHNVTSKKGDKFKSSTGKSGGFTHTFNKKGTFTIICTKHPTQMRMTVKVT